MSVGLFARITRKPHGRTFNLLGLALCRSSPFAAETFTTLPQHTPKSDENGILFPAYPFGNDSQSFANPEHHAVEVTDKQNQTLRDEARNFCRDGYETYRTFL